jgi:hypothetical protein
MGLTNLAAAVQAQGDYARADTLYRESLALHQSVKQMLGIVFCLAGLAGVAGWQARLERAARLAGAAEAHRHRMGIHPDPVVQAIYDSSIATACAHLDEATFAAAFAAGQAMSPEQAIAEALDR